MNVECHELNLKVMDGDDSLTCIFPAAVTQITGKIAIHGYYFFFKPNHSINQFKW